jgi:hypothetical protein
VRAGGTGNDRGRAKRVCTNSAQVVNVKCSLSILVLWRKAELFISQLCVNCEELSGLWPTQLLLCRTVSRVAARQ